MLSLSTTQPGIQTDEEENGGDESVGGTTGEATKRRIAKISERGFKKKRKNLSTQNVSFFYTGVPFRKEEEDKLYEKA